MCLQAVGCGVTEGEEGARFRTCQEGAEEALRSAQRFEVAHEVARIRKAITGAKPRARALAGLELQMGELSGEDRRRMPVQHRQQIMERRALALLCVNAMLQRLVAGEACKMARGETAETGRYLRRLGIKAGAGHAAGLVQHGLAQVLPLFHRNDRQPQRRFPAAHVDVSPAHGPSVARSVPGVPCRIHGSARFQSGLGRVILPVSWG